jgi:CPA1 family monovalent cation:H+ antiporter
VALGCKFVRLPYTIALVAVGLALGLMRPFFSLQVQLTPELLFTVLLPALLFEAAIHLPVAAVRKNMRSILLLAVPGMLISAFLTGWGMHLSLGLLWQPALVFGALISATDPISVLALFKRMRAPQDLAVIVEGESLLNDGAAVVLFNILVAAEHVSLASGVGSFLFESLGGLTIGAAIGWLISRITERIDDHLIEVTFSTILAYSSYLIAQACHTSGVMAVIAAGLVYGNLAMTRSAMSVNTRLSLAHTWEYLGFLCNSLVFLLIGTQADLSKMATMVVPILIAFGVVNAARLAALLMLAPFSQIPRRWLPVVFWSGLRGSIAMALGMALALPEREELLLITFGVVLLSLFVQGLTVKPLLQRLGIVSRQGPLLEYESRLGELMAHERALALLQKSQARYHISQEVFDEQAEPLQRSIERLRAEMLQYQTAEVLHEQRREAGNLVAAAQRLGLRDAYLKGLISEETYHSLRNKLGDEGDSKITPEIIAGEIDP